MTRLTKEQEAAIQRLRESWPERKKAIEKYRNKGGGVHKHTYCVLANVRLGSRPYD